jgi:hypothetical protein
MTALDTRIRLLLVLLGILTTYGSPAFADEMLIIGGRQLGPFKVGAPIRSLIERIGQTPLAFHHNDQDTFMLWEDLGLVVATRGERIVMVQALFTRALAPEARAVIMGFRTPEGVGLGDQQGTLETRLGTPLSRGTIRLNFPGWSEGGPIVVDRWVYTASRLQLDIVAGYVVGIGVFGLEMLNVPAQLADTKILPGERIGPLSLGVPSAALLHHFGQPSDQQPRGSKGVVLHWAFGADALAVEVDAGFQVDGVTIRHYEPTPRMVGELRSFATAQGLRLGDPITRVTVLLGEPRARSTVSAPFVLAAQSPARRVDVERWEYDGLVVEVRNGQVWGLGVTPRAAPRRE